MPVWNCGVNGGSGSPGPEGPMGPQGPQGETGPQGPQGDAGSTGATGSTGPQGPAGNDGAPGNNGSTGPEGPQGEQGLQGIQGIQGNTGPAGSDGWTYVSLVSNFANSTTSMTAVTGMSFTGTLNTNYEIEIFGAFQSAATTTGIAFGFDIPSGSVHGFATHPISATALGSNENIADNASTGATTGVRAANTNVPCFGKFLVKLGAGGTIQLVVRSEISASAVTLQGGLFYMKYRII
jgi:hypothetical protein